jgi:hypothetical protein
MEGQWNATAAIAELLRATLELARDKDTNGLTLIRARSFVSLTNLFTDN